MKKNLGEKKKKKMDIHNMKKKISKTHGKFFHSMQTITQYMSYNISIIILITLNGLYFFFLKQFI